MLAGATVISVGTSSFIAPDSCQKLIDGLWGYCKDNNIEKISQLTGALI